MRNILIFSAFSVFLLTGCFWNFDKDRMKGSGIVTKEQRAVSSFDKIEIAGAFKVHLSQGDIESVEVEIDDNLQPYVEVRNTGSKLILKFEDSIKLRNITKSNVYITMKNIDLFCVTGVCTLKMDGALNVTFLTIDVQGVFNTELELYCDQLNADLNGVANIELRGNTEELKIVQKGVGKFNARNMEAAIVDVVNSGVGSVSVYATQELSMTNSGVGSITYSGDAIVKTIHSSGIGKIKKE